MGNHHKPSTPNAPAPLPVAPLIPVTDQTGGYIPNKKPSATAQVLTGSLGEPDTALPRVLGG